MPKFVQYPTQVVLNKLFRVKIWGQGPLSLRDFRIFMKKKIRFNPI